MNTVDRVIENIKQEEINGEHERTYLLMDAFDMLLNNEIEENNEDLNKNLDYRLGYFVSEGVKEARKEMLVIGSIALVLVGGYKLLKQQICKKKNDKIELKEEA